jgi:NADH-quinone oxidoreductase subunit K
MLNETALLNNYLIVGAMLFGLGAIGFVSRRNVIVMFLSLEIMLQGVSLSLAAWGRFNNDFGGQTLVLFIIAVASCEAALALALVLTLFYRRGRLDISDWSLLREANQPAFQDRPPPMENRDCEEPLPHLAPAGARPGSFGEQPDCRPKV